MSYLKLNYEEILDEFPSVKLSYENIILLTKKIIVIYIVLIYPMIIDWLMIMRTLIL